MDIYGEKQHHQYEWGYTKKEELTSDAFLEEVKGVFSSNDVVSVGEYHDLRQDNSYNWIKEHDFEILYMYSLYKESTARDDLSPMLTFLKLLPPNSRLWDRMTKEFPSVDQLRENHVGRLFTYHILPIARNQDFTNLLLEGLDDQDPARTIRRSKDQIGDLLRLTMAMMMGMKIHGAYADGLMPTPVDVGNALFSKMQRIKENDPEAKLVVYNGAAHNMTEPFKKGTFVGSGILQFDAHDMSYVPQAKKLWGDKYGSIDLLSGHRKLEGLGHFSVMQEKAADNKITLFEHGIGQKSFVIK